MTEKIELQFIKKMFGRRDITELHLIKMWYKLYDLKQLDESDIWDYVDEKGVGWYGWSTDVGEPRKHGKEYKSLFKVTKDKFEIDLSDRTREIKKIGQLFKPKKSVVSPDLKKLHFPYIDTDCIQIKIKTKK